MTSSGPSWLRCASRLFKEELCLEHPEEIPGTHMTEFLVKGFIYPCSLQTKEDQAP